MRKRINEIKRTRPGTNVCSVGFSQLSDMMENVLRTLKRVLMFEGKANRKTLRSLNDSSFGKNDWNPYNSMFFNISALDTKHYRY